MAVLLDVRDIAFAYDERLVLDGVSFSLQPREVVGLVGPNGSGKSTLLHLLLGLHTVQRGTISLDETPLYTHSRKELAKRIALVPQETALEFTFAVRDIVAMGRNPHLGRFRPETVTDAEAIRWALEHTETAHLAARSVHTLSGGERRRVFIARALAQQPQLFLLDEPTANLDLSHQLETLALVRTLAQEGRCALIALHDLALAVRFCDRILLLSGGRIAAQGCPEEVITEAHLATYFGIRAKIRRDEETGVLLVVPLAPTASCDTTTRITPYC